MKFRRRSSEMFDGLSERDAARLEAALGQAQPTPGMERLPLRVKVATGGTPEQVTERGPIRSSDVVPRKRGRRA